MLFVLETRGVGLFSKFWSQDDNFKSMQHRHRCVAFHWIFAAHPIFTLFSGNSFSCQNKIEVQKWKENTEKNLRSTLKTAPAIRSFSLILRTWKCRMVCDSFWAENMQITIFREFLSKLDNFKMMSLWHRCVIFHEILFASFTSVLMSWNSFLCENSIWN